MSVLATRVLQAKTRWQRLSDQRTALSDERERLLLAVGHAKFRLELAPEVQGFLDSLLWTAHARSVGLFEQLLTALVHDVLPEYQAPVRLRYGMEKGLPSLDIEVGADGSTIDLVHGAGGSLVNVISAGLRFIALARSTLRPFLVLDEPDCWLAPARVIHFSEVIAQMAHEIGVQMVLISHHDPALFPHIPDRVALAQEAGGLQATASWEDSYWDDAAKPGLRWIRLQDFMSHRDTLVPLAPGATLLTGPNHSGKSAVMTALRAIGYGTSSDAWIRHGTAGFCVSVGLEHGQVLECRRALKGKHKTLYRLLDADGAILHEERGERNGVPDWAEKALNLRLLDGLDVQLNSQKTPVFLLNERSTVRASLLSAGMESHRIKDMMTEYRAMITEDRGVVKRGEDRMRFLDPAMGIPEWDAVPADMNWDAQLLRAEELERAVQDLQAQRTMLVQRDLRQHVDGSLGHVSLPTAPALTPTQPLLTRLSRLAAVRALLGSGVSVPRAPVPEAPVVTPLMPLVWQLRRVWAARQARKAMAPLKSLVLPEAPSVPGVGRVQDLLSRRDTLSAQQAVHQTEYDNIAAELLRLQSMFAKHPFCPACQRPYTTGETPHDHTD